MPSTEHCELPVAQLASKTCLSRTANACISFENRAAGSKLGTSCCTTQRLRSSDWCERSRVGVGDRLLTTWAGRGLWRVANGRCREICLIGTTDQSLESVRMRRYY